jgi:mRNA deadenylase 3'-5' endonuclease subunit Ccr4
LLPELKKHGYDSVYKKKNSDLYTGQQYAADGCATFWKGSKFKMMKKYEVCRYAFNLSRETTSCIIGC